MQKSISGNNALIAKYNIERWLIGKLYFQYFQNKNFLLKLSKNEFSFTVEFRKLIFTYWTDSKSESWHVINYKIKADLLYFDVYYPFKKEVISFLLKGINAINLANQPELFNQRKNYLSFFCNLVKEEIPNIKIKKATVSNVPKVGEKIGIAKLLFSQENILIAALSVSGKEGINIAESLLSQSLIWLNNLNKQLTPKSIDKLMVFSPKKMTALLGERLTLLTNCKTKIELFEIDENKGAIFFVNPFDQGYLPLESKLVNVKNSKYRKPIPKNIQKEIEWIKSLAPNLLKEEFNKNQLSLHINGLVFVTTNLTKVIRYKYLEETIVLTPENKLHLENLVKEIALYRSNKSPNKQHYYYKTLAESWLRGLVSQNVSILDPTLLNCVYSQVQVSKAHNKFIDLLCINNEGQLVIIELKVVEDIDLVFQSLDYWLRIEWYRVTEELIRKRYFFGLSIQNTPAKIYLVAPRLRIHKELKYLASLVDKKVPIYLISINDNWRESLKVESRERLN